MLAMLLHYTCDAPLQYFASGHTVNSCAPPVISVHFVFTPFSAHDINQTVASKPEIYTTEIDSVRSTCLSVDGGVQGS